MSDKATHAVLGVIFLALIWSQSKWPIALVLTVAMIGIEVYVWRKARAFKRKAS